jgi:hypothetical protein
MMNELEKKLRENYLALKREDEKAIPAFDSFFKGPRQTRHPGKLKPFKALKIAAVFIAVSLALAYYFSAHVRPRRQTMEIQAIYVPSPLPSRSLLHENDYLWHWKASTDHLIEEAKKLTISSS